MLTGTGTNTTQTTNITDSSATGTTADYTTFPPTADVDILRLNDNADGTSVDAVFDDVSGNTRRTGSPDAGASETTDDGLPAEAAATTAKVFLVTR